MVLRLGDKRQPSKLALVIVALAEIRYWASHVLAARSYLEIHHPSLGEA